MVQYRGGANHGTLQCLYIFYAIRVGLASTFYSDICWACACTNNYTKAKFTKLYTVQSRQVSYWLQELYTKPCKRYDTCLCMPNLQSWKLL